MPRWALTPASSVDLGPTPLSGLHLAAPASQERYPALGPRSARRVTPGSTQQLAQADAACALQENIAAMEPDIALYVKLASTARTLELWGAACAPIASQASIRARELMLASIVMLASTPRAQVPMHALP